MKTKSTTFDMRKSVIRALGIPAFILMIPVVAMQFSSEWDWDVSDFIIIGTLLVSAVLLYEFASRKMSKHKTAIAIAIVLGVAFIWAELAVGIFTNWGS
jgi:hypothetical protein